MKCSIVVVVVLLSLAALAASTTNPSLTTLTNNDNDVLNYALTLEHLEATFYSELIAKFSSSDFTKAGYSKTDYSYFQLIAAHEKAHAALLTSTLLSRGAKPVAACTYDYNKSPIGPLSNNLQKYVQLSRVLENTGTSAYDGAIDYIYDKSLQEVAASIATVEGRHASYLNNLNDVVPFPSDFDTPLNDTTVFAMVSPILVSCPDTVELPRTYIVVPVSTSHHSNPTQTELNENDIVTLNYALTLEHLEATFYNTFQKKYTSSDFQKAGFSKGTYNYLNLIMQHENAHVAALTATITSLGGKPVPACTYDFSSITSVKTYLETGRAFEAVGVSAYDGAVNTLTDLTLRQVAATIATVEGRHASYLNLIQHLTPFPNTTDPTRTPAEVVSIVHPTYIKSCPYTLEGPVVLVVVPENNAPPSHHNSAAGSLHPSFFVAIFAALIALFFLY